MTLSEQYLRQVAWRDWKTALAACPVCPRQRILDLGCGTGTVARLLVEAGATVTGVDGNAELLAVARANCPEGTFHLQDVGALSLDGGFDGLWCSFAVAYIPDLAAAFSHWQKFLRPGAWVCLVEMDGLLDHEPLPEVWRQRVEEFYAQSQAYDFRRGRKLRGILEGAGCSVRELELQDAELSFQGPGNAAVLASWGQRLDRMVGLQKFLGTEFPSFRKEFLVCLASPAHRSDCRVHCVVGT